MYPAVSLSRERTLAKTYVPPEAMKLHNETQEIGMILNFLHHFPRFASTPDHFAPYDLHYQQYLQYIVTISCAMGFAVFLSLLILLLRRWRFAQQDAFAFRYAFSADVPAVLLLGITTLSALAGLLGEARVEYAVHTSHEVLTNASHVFDQMRNDGNMLYSSALTVDTSSDDFLVAYANQSAHLPMAEITEITALARKSTELRHVSTRLQFVLKSLPDFTPKAQKWEYGFYWLKGSTNTVITGIAMASIIGIISIGWSMSSSIRWSLLITLWTIPMAHTLVGFYLSGAIAGADFCLAPQLNTLQVLNSSNSFQQELISYYVYCDDNTTSIFHPTITDLTTKNNQNDPFASIVKETQEITKESMQYVLDLSEFAQKHPDFLKMQEEFLTPLHIQLSTIQKQLEDIQTQSGCQNLNTMYSHAIDTFCDYGVIGAFSLWVHQMVLCLLLLLCVICTASVWERVEARETRMDRQYQLLASYEEDNVEHVYLTPE